MDSSYVLVVDPNPATARRVREALADWDLGVLSASTPDGALQKSEGHDIAIVLSSASLPKGSGYEVASAFRDAHPAAATFLMVGGFEVYNRRRAELAGVIGDVPKPFSAETLRDRLAEVLGPAGAPAAPGKAAPPGTEDEAEAPRPRRDNWRPPISAERIASLLQRNYDDLPLVRVDPDLIGSEMEAAILAVLPEVVERVLRTRLATDPVLQRALERAVEKVLEDNPEALLAALRDEVAKAG